jgi:dethiobiotin synthetase
VSAYFITAAGTEVGKTVVATILCRQLRALGKRVRAVKPVITDFDDECPEGTDTALLLEAQGLEVTPETIADISPWRFCAALSPDMAARREGLCIDFRALVEYCAGQRGGDADLLLFEGIGGVMVPLTENLTVADWITALDVPTILVTGSYLGSLSHGLTAAEALKTKGVPVAAVVVSESPENPVPLVETVDTLRRFLRPMPVLALPRLAAGADAWQGAPDLTAALTPAS